MFSLIFNQNDFPDFLSLFPNSHDKHYPTYTLKDFYHADSHFFSFFLATSGTFLYPSLLLLFSVIYGYSQGSSWFFLPFKRKVFYCRFFTIQKKFQLRPQQQQVKQTNITLSILLIKLILKFHSFLIRFPGFYLALQS